MLSVTKRRLELVQNRMESLRQSTEAEELGEGRVQSVGVHSGWGAGKALVGSSKVLWARCLWDYDWQGLPGLGDRWTRRLAHWAGVLRGWDRAPGGRKKNKP